MIQIVNASLAFGGQTILNDTTVSVRDGRRIGLVGPNGAGKTTLLKALAGRQRLDEGTLDVPGGTTIGYLEQDVQEGSTDRSVLDEALDAFREVIELEQREHALTDELDAEPDHTSAHYERLLHELDDLHTELVTREAHTIRPRTEAVLTGLGFAPDDLDRPLRTFSGGWRMRVTLAKLLLRRPDVLLLDEPTNHLDIDSIAWLESFLKGYPGTVVLVSHDRYFLDRMVNETIELVQGQATSYEGNYSFYLDTREERRAIQKASYENQQKEIADIERFVERFRAQATKAKQAQSRLKMLERMDRLDAPPDDAPTVNFRFPAPARAGKVVLEVSEFSKTYVTSEGRVEVFRKAGPLHVERGDHVALIGKNGAGKSTLARIIKGEESFEGERKLGHNVKVTFFAQHQADTLDPKATVLESLQEVSRGQSETELRTLAGAFLFRGDAVFKPIAVLSGGERSRVALARTLLTPANLMILDEPTNHLDMASIGVLVEALQALRGHLRRRLARPPLSRPGVEDDLARGRRAGAHLQGQLRRLPLAGRARHRRAHGKAGRPRAGQGRRPCRAPVALSARLRQARVHRRAGIAQQRAQDEGAEARRGRGPQRRLPLHPGRPRRSPGQTEQQRPGQAERGSPAERRALAGGPAAAATPRPRRRSWPRKRKRPPWRCASPTRRSTRTPPPFAPPPTPTRPSSASSPRSTRPGKPPPKPSPP